MTLTARMAPASGRPGNALASTRRWSLAHVLAIAGLPILVWEAWTVVAWLTDDPHSITQFRDTSSASWYAARAFEAAMVIVSILVAIHVVRDCRRQRRLLTFDVMFCLAAASGIWADLSGNFFQPIFLPSSNWINVNAMCGHMPFIVNPDCGRSPDPLIFWLLGAFGYLGLAMVGGRGIRWIRERWPGISTAKLVLVVCLAGAAAGLIIELPLISLGLWSYAPSAVSIPLGKGLHYPIILETIAGGLFLAATVLVRALKNDRGQTFIERGMDHLKPRKQRVVTLLAFYTVFQLANWLVGAWLVWAVGPYERPWPATPAHILNEVCDAAGVHGTRYGPCPGSPGYRMPGRTSLEGRSP